MDQPIVSTRELQICILVSILILLVLTAQSYLLNKRYFVVCNTDSHLNTYIHLDTMKDIIVDPKELKSTFDCLGKAMPFYDRDIAFVMGTPPARVKKGITERYTVSSYESESFSFNNHLYVINTNKSSIYIQGNTKYLIAKKNANVVELVKSIDTYNPEVLVIDEDSLKKNLILNKALKSRIIKIINVRSNTRKIVKM